MNDRATQWQCDDGVTVKTTSTVSLIDRYQNVNIVTIATSVFKEIAAMLEIIGAVVHGRGQFVLCRSENRSRANLVK